MSRYNENVRIGNWFDDLVLHEEILKQYVRKHENFELKVQKLRKLFISLLTEVPLTVQGHGLSYGSVIQIMCKDAPTSKQFQIEKGQGLVLAADIDYRDTDQRVNFAAGDPVIASGLLTPCVRNTWTLVPCDPALNRQPIRFGDSLYIRLQSGEYPLYVEAPCPFPTSPTGECGHVVPKLVGSPTGLSRFQIAHIYSWLRYETLGEIVPPFENVILIHCSSSEALAIECDTWIPTYFGMECEVSVKNFFIDNRKPLKHNFRNFWRLMLSSV